MSGTLTHGRQTIAWNNPLAPGTRWVKASETDLDPIVKNCVIVAELPDAEGHPSVPDGIVAGEFTSFYPTDVELAREHGELTDVAGA
ncbi:hypothetical protein GXW83_18950 [Streptacidiphilus sp. PB12-B1b]|uniref:hypothetical protein n=1 Tax=Streptacidiphilus sp. PB12-B1b TaxID=2705012 RepID=UPI0015FCD07E|nr:hypothetical protein [Streptacidiphilus sp. PB12-B1b]QMU77466.1 hypothetical protein GXW83_18950 [Streptacidiphilus sp. PB12-B1b]